MMLFQINAQVGRATLGSGHLFVGYTWCIMLIVGSNQDFQWTHHTPTERMPRAKLIARYCLEKQLVMNLHMDALGLVEQHSDPNVVCVNSSTH